MQRINAKGNGEEKKEIDRILRALRNSGGRFTQRLTSTFKGEINREKKNPSNKIGSHQILVIQ